MNKPAPSAVSRSTMGIPYIFAISVIAAILCSGCAALNDQQADDRRVLDPLTRGDVSRAATNAKVAARINADGPDAVLAHLEAGAVLQSAGRIADSRAAFAAANAAIAELDARPTVSARDVGGQLGAIVTNPKTLPYRGTNADRILLHTLQALNYLEQNDVGGARVELNRAYQRQQDAVDRFQREIEAAGALLRRQQLNPSQVNLGQARRALKHRGAVPTAAYADFVNPFTTYLDALFYMATASSGSDSERARKSLERTAAFVLNPEALAPERQFLADLAANRSSAPAVVVVTAIGLGPRREEWRLDLPLPTRPVTHAGLALPCLAFDPFGPEVAVVGADNLEIADLYQTVAAEFDATYDAKVLQAVAGAATKVTAQLQLRRNLGQAGWLAGVLGSIELTGADLRTWRTAPARIQRSWLPRPADGKLRLQRTPGGAPEIFELPEAPLVLVYVRRIANAPLHVAPIGFN